MVVVPAVAGLDESTRRYEESRIAAARPYARRAARQQHARSPECLAAPFALDQRGLGLAPLLAPRMDFPFLGSPRQPGSAVRLFAGASSGPPDFPPPAQSRALPGGERPGRGRTTQAA